MSCPVNNMFHGSMRQIDGEIIPHKGRNRLGGKGFNQYAVYATPHFLSAIVYSLSIDRSRIFSRKEVFISYSPNQIYVQMKGCYWSRKIGYVYVIPPDSFQPLNDYEWFAYSRVPILQSLEITPEYIEKLIDDKHLIIESDSVPQNAFYKKILRIEEKFVKLTSILKHAFWTRITRQ